jgi:predicted O-methyltransferase YrrM
MAAKLKAEYGHAPPLPGVYRQMLDWQMYALYGLAWEQCRAVHPRDGGGRVLEIGTGFGSSTYMLSKAWPLVEIVSLTISEREAEQARGFLKRAGMAPVTVLVKSSLDYLAETGGRPWRDLIFVDGDHRRAAADLVWFNALKPGGALLFHDYSPQACPPVYAAVNALGACLGREPDVLLMDTDRIGLAGFYRREGEQWRG